MKITTVGLLCVHIWTAIISVTKASKTFDLCGTNEISGENFTLSLHFSTENANKTGDECSRVILLKSKRVNLTVEEADLASGVVFEIQDGPAPNQGVKLWSKPGADLPSSFLSSSNAMFIRFKDDSKGGNGKSIFRGKISSFPYQDTCHCRGVTNGKLECSESEHQRWCEVKCNTSYMELSVNRGMTCDLVKGEWDINIHSMPLACRKVQTPLDVKTTVNFSYVNLTCQQVDVEKVGSVFRAFIANNSDIGSKGLCFGSGGNDTKECKTRLQVNCTTNSTYASTQVTITDRVMEPATLKEAYFKLQDLYRAYNNLNFKNALDSGELVVRIENRSLTVANESLVSLVSPWCGDENDYIKVAGNETSFVCSTCPLNHLYNATTYVCQKCPFGTFASERATSCTQKDGVVQTPKKTSCDNKCMKGKRMDGESWMCEWCPPNTYQNSSTRINPDCTPCPGKKKTLFPGARDVADCRDTCPSGTFLSASSGACTECPTGSYMDVESHVLMRCKMCEMGKTTQASGSKSVDDCYECMEGQFYNSSFKTCSPCPKGTYQDEVNKDICKDCGHGKVTLEYGSNSTSDCVLVCGRGQYLNETNEACLDCQLNTYQDTAEHRFKECKSCGVNKITNATGRYDIFQCFSCSKGSFLDKSVSQCKNCLKGTFQDQPGQDRCKPCPDGMTTASDRQWNESACIAVQGATCSKGQYYNPRNKSCHPCIYGTYQESESHLKGECKKCPSKETSVEEGAFDPKQCITTDVKDKFEAIKMSIRFTSLFWSEELENKNSVTYRETKASIEEAIRSELRKDPSFEDVSVTGMRQGSIIADFDLYFNDKVGYHPGEALQVAARNGKVGNMTVSPESLKILRQNCAQPLGMENGNIKNDQITASNHVKNHEPYKGRLNAKGERGWEAENMRMVEYLQIDFEREVNITAVATQGQSTSDLYVKEYKLSTSDDGQNWVEYTENGKPKIFRGNQDSNTVDRNSLASTITCRFLRFRPQSWNVRIFMRVEVYGCLPNALIATERPPATTTGISPKVAAIKAGEDKWPWGAYLGVAFAALLVIGIVVAVICWKKKSKEKGTRSEADESLIGMHKYGDGQYRVIEKNATELDDGDENVV